MMASLWLPPWSRVAAEHTVPSRLNPGRPVTCCWADCTRPGDKRIHVSKPHERPSRPGELIVFLFCSAAHRAHFVERSRHQAFQR